MQKKCPPWKAPWKPGEDIRIIEHSKIGLCLQVRPGGRESGWSYRSRMEDRLYPVSFWGPKQSGKGIEPATLNCVTN